MQRIKTIVPYYSALPIGQCLSEACSLIFRLKHLPSSEGFRYRK